MMRVTAALVLLACWCSLAPLGYGQTSSAAGAITGQVDDVITGDDERLDAVVTATNTETGSRFSASTDPTGRYMILLVPPGTYVVEAESAGFLSQLMRAVRVSVGETTTVDFELAMGAETLVIDVEETLPMTDPRRTQQAAVIREEWIRQLPIDRRDYLSYTLLAPGVVDAEALADANDFRVVQTEHSGLSFFGNNGRGNSIRLDGSERDTAAGAVRPTISQEAVREFQINRANYSAESGSASGAVINIVSRSGTNFWHGSLYGFFRHGALDAGDPFARTFVNGVSRRIKPPSDRQQFGGTLGGPIDPNRTFIFGSFEGLNSDEFNSVPVLTSLDVFSTTPQQEAVLETLSAPEADALRTALTASPETVELFEINNGVFPFHGTDYKISVRLDHSLTTRDQVGLRYGYANIDETNPNTRALVGISRGYERSKLDHTAALTWTRTQNPSVVNQARLQFGYYGFRLTTNDEFGPELNIDGFGKFNRDFTLPSRNILRRTEFSDTLNVVRGPHLVKIGGQLLIRNTNSESHTLMGGRFDFGPLPGGLVSPSLASTTLTSLQAFNLGLPQLYQQGFGQPTVASTDPYFAVFIEDTWRADPSFTLSLGLRYELDDRKDPLPTDRNNVAPRIGFAWTPWGSETATIRGGYGIYYAPISYAVDGVVNLLGNIDDHRQIAQVFTTIQTPGAASASNVFQTLSAQGVITLPSPTRSISAADLGQFGIVVAQDGPVPPLSVLFRNSEDLSNAYSHQASLGIEYAVAGDWLVAADYVFGRTLRIARARDDNLLPAPISPILGIPVWSTPYFKNPALLQDNVYESTGQAFYHGVSFELTRRFLDNFSFNANYTLSKAIDEVTDFNSDFQPNDQTNLRAERALSSFDQRHKVVVYALVQTPSGSTGLRRLLSGLVATPIFRFNSARPFNLLVGSDLNGDRHSTTDRPPFAGRNTGRGPSFWTFDARLTKRFALDDERQLEVMVEAFNLLNRLNFRSVNNVVGNVAGPFDVSGRDDRTPSEPLAFTSAFEARRVQLGIRFSF